MTTNPTTKENTMTTKTKTLTDPDGDKLTIDGYPGALVITTQQSLTAATVRNIDPADLIAAIREVAGVDEVCHCGKAVVYGYNGNPGDTRGLCQDCQDVRCDAYPGACEPAPSESPTADDFTKAEFARNKYGRIAGRVDGDSPQWRASDMQWLSDTDMAEEGWQIVTPAPTTARDLLAMLPGMCYEPEDGVIPADSGYISIRNDGDIMVCPGGHHITTPANGANFRRLLLDPPALKRPEGAETIQDALVSIWPTDDLDGIEAAADHIAARVRVVPGEVEA